MKPRIHSTFWITFDDLTQEERARLDRATSYLMPGARFSQQYKAGVWDGMKHFLTAANKLPYGLFTHLFPNNSLSVDKAYVPYTFDTLQLYKANPTFERRDYQLDAVNQIFSRKRGLIQAVVGSGKTWISAVAARQHLHENPNGKVLFICYDTNILLQTIENYTKYGFTVSQYGDSIKDLSGEVVVATIQSLNNITNVTAALKDITFCFIDESHHAKAKSSRDILSKLRNCNYYIGLTATPPDERSIEFAELASVTGGIIFKFGFADAVAANNIAPVKVFFIEYDSAQETTDALMFTKHYATAWNVGIRDNPVRNQLIAEINQRLLATYPDTASIICVDRVEHGTAVSAQLAKTGISLHQMYGSDDSVSRVMKKKSLTDGHTDTIISSVLKEGVDLPQAPVFAINAMGRLSPTNMIQFIGRTVRKNSHYKTFRVAIDFIDTATLTVYEHSKKRMMECNKYGFDYEKVSSVDQLLEKVAEYYKTCV